MRIGHRLALTTTLLLALSITGLAPVSTPPTVAALGTLSVDRSDPAASDTTCAPCKTIQGAIKLAGPGAGITVAPGTYPETLTITQSMSITGGIPLQPGEQGPTIVDAGGTGRVVTIPSTALPETLVSLTGLTLTDGIASGSGSGGGIAALAGTVSLSDTIIMSNTATDGGGIYARNAVMLTNSPVMSNTATNGDGGGIDARNAATLTNSPVLSNTATGSYGFGGGIDASNAVTLTDSPVAGNTATNAGGILGGPVVTLTNSPVMNNTATNGGGGIWGGAVTLTSSPVLSNTAASGSGGGIEAYTATLTSSPVLSNTTSGVGGGLLYWGTALVLTSTIAGNTAGSGGGLAGMASTVATLLSSAVLSNTARSGDGGGILNSGSLRLTNSTLSANSAITSGGAISSTGSLTASFSTLSANSALSGGGIAATTGATTTLQASILAGNTAPSGPDCAGAVTSLGDNLIGDADGCSGLSAVGDLSGSGAGPLDPRLGLLADNGGPTLTQALLPDSPAIGHVPAARCSDASDTALSSDQRGVMRLAPGDLSESCDSGAYEYGPLIRAVSPNSGPVAGGTQVVISGTDLEGTGAVSVTFGGIAATNVLTDASGQLITATTPAHAAGTVDVAMGMLQGTRVITTPLMPADQFTYVGASAGTPTGTSTTTAAAMPISATIQNFAFSPNPITVTPGTTVTWTNLDSVTHTVTADDQSWDSGPLGPGATYSHVFTSPSSYTYHCAFHPSSMTGTVVVSTSMQSPTVTTTPTSTPTSTPQPTATVPPSPTRMATPLPPSTAQPVVVAPTSTSPAGTPTGGATTTTQQGLVATATATVRPVLGTATTATPTRPATTATRGAVAPCRRALPLRVRLSSRTVRSAGTVIIRAQTVSRARLSVGVQVLAKKTVVTGTGTHRRRVVRSIVVYRAGATGKADARGRFRGRVQVTYRVARQTRALLTVTARAGCAARTARLPLTILPRRRH